ncbi:MAG: hypothetical protein JWR61_1656 [Ferruginibacter sp.]|uniref:hypothetical protein n=1 Tax=Ferruginibacter sp. TaxID=1940288 RepID=UPI0026583926|nr:hypothetical protein [Ferruginibacter sp.]MDB5276701.1 hypothetical protein [Ferruginibacter sp.]
MKNILLNIVISFACLTAILSLMSAGCDNEESNTGYHYVNIPGFEEADYIPMLNSSNEEIQYNAVCYFAGHNYYDHYLMTDSLRKTGSYDTALLLYQKIYPMMNSKNSWVSSAAVLFISKFQYNRPAFVNFALTNTNPSKNVQLEIIAGLLEDSAKDSRLLQQKVSFLKQQPSWLLQNGVYQLIGEYDSVSSEPLIREYKEMKDDYKKILVLDVLCNHMTDKVFSFVANEWASTKNERIKKMISSNIVFGHNHRQVLNWYAAHWPVLEQNMEEMIEMASENKTRNISSELIVMALSRGWKPSSVLQIKGVNENEYDGQPRLFITLKLHQPYRDSSSDKYSPALISIENALLQNPSLKNEWQAFEKRFTKYPLPSELISQQKKLTATYLQQTAMLLQQYKIDTSLANNFMQGINYQLNALTGSRISRKEKE